MRTRQPDCRNGPSNGLAELRSQPANVQRLREEVWAAQVGTHGLIRAHDNMDHQNAELRASSGGHAAGLRHVTEIRGRLRRAEDQLQRGSGPSVGALQERTGARAE